MNGIALRMNGIQDGLPPQVFLNYERRNQPHTHAGEHGRCEYGNQVFDRDRTTPSSRPEQLPTYRRFKNSTGHSTWQSKSRATRPGKPNTRFVRVFALARGRLR
jgi:hypothetical protein